jgi:hypothetical protein
MIGNAMSRFVAEARFVSDLPTLPEELYSHQGVQSQSCTSCDVGSSVGSLLE